MKTDDNVKLGKEVQTILDVFKSSNGELKPHFILTGPSGSGKTYIIEQLVASKEMHFVGVNAAQLTKEGTSGNSISKALAPLAPIQGQLSVCFVDEFDKLFISGNENSDLAHEITNGVQNEFLKMLESDKTAIFGDYGKYYNIDVSKVLFIFAGAFNGEEDITLDRLREFGIKTEFLGRVGLTYSTTKLSFEYLVAVLKQSEMLKKYLKLFPAAKKANAVKIISGFLESNYEKNTIGVRLVNTLIHQYFIKGGKLDEPTVKKMSFQTTLEFNQ